MTIEIESVRATVARAALKPALWSEALLSISRLIGSDMTLFEHIDKKTNLVEHGFNDRPELVAATRSAYENHFYRINPRYAVARARPLHELTDDDRVGDERALGRNEFYVDFLKPCGLKYFIGSAVADDAEQTVVFSLQRAADRGRVDDEVRRLFAEVLPDIRNAIGLNLRFSQAHLGTALIATFDRLSDPLAVLRADGRMVFANRAMAGLIAAGDLVRLNGTTLEGNGDRVSRLLGEAMRLAQTAGAPATMAGSNAKPAGRLVVRVAPLDADSRRDFSPAGERLFCILIDDLSRPKWNRIADAMRLFGLTRKETMVGNLLAEGYGINEIAARLLISRNTVRSHLAILRDKLSVRHSLAVAARMRELEVRLS